MNMCRFWAENICYHIFNRGNHQDNIFLDQNDFIFYLKQMKFYKRKYGVKLYAYCLMPNHVHMLGEPPGPLQLSKFMQGLQRSYTAYFNNKYQKSGHLWQGRFKTRIITKDRHLGDCLTYVEHNPVKANLVKNPEDYKFSSYFERNLENSQYLKIVDPL